MLKEKMDIISYLKKSNIENVYSSFENSFIKEKIENNENEEQKIKEEEEKKKDNNNNNENNNEEQNNNNVIP